ncbi:response regulator [Fulvivirgaceae bacterium BMA10]|uniref:Response regulator n=1 Tax=Splendidivirga corallicola TaxID=3051826 RepID=A0ABT8KR72_9BACT|nr:response regulator [Fulvivirgaceae bacterium BMA10]
MRKANAVMVIDDDKVNNFIFKKVITSSQIAEDIIMHYGVTDALNDINEMLENHPHDLPDLIFLDINMPILSGWDFLEAYKELVPKFSKKVNLFMFSSSVSSNDIERAKSYDEVEDYISKPLTLDILEDIQRKYLS